MRTPKDLASNFLVSEKEHRTRGTTLRRVAGGVRAQISGELSLNDAERKLLASAASLLETMADTSNKAATLARKRTEDVAAREKAIVQAMATNFGSLHSVADQVAFIGAVQSYTLKDIKQFDDPSRLRVAFKDALDGLAYTLARPQDPRSALEVVTEAWAKFEAGKEEILKKHLSLIGLLTMRGADNQAALIAGDNVGSK